MPYKNTPENKAKRRLYEKEYRIKNKAKIAEREKLYKEKNKVRDSIKKKEWKKKNPEKVKESRHRTYINACNRRIESGEYKPRILLTEEEKKQRNKCWRKRHKELNPNITRYKGYTEQRRTQDLRETELLKDTYVKKKLKRKGFSTETINGNKKIIGMQRFIIKTKRLSRLKYNNPNTDREL